MKWKTIDLCAGIGGIRRGFELTGCFENVLSAEIDEQACQTYQLLYGDDPRNDLTSREFKDKVKATKYDVLLAGFPCQAFSIAGNRQGFDDEKDDFDLISRSDNQKLDLNKTLIISV